MIIPPIPILQPFLYSERETPKFVDVAITPGQPPLRFETPPTIIYHYTSTITAQLIVKNHQLKFSAPDTFNDPFDMYEGLLDYKATPKQRAERIKNITVGIPRKNRKILKKVSEQGDRYTQMNIHGFRMLKKDIGVCCFSEEPGVQLMWSHYASKHNGVCLGFNFNPFSNRSDLSLFILKVKYPDKIEPVNFHDHKDLALNYFLTCKSKAWAYEKEIRAIITDRRNIDFFDFERACLKEIYFGCRVSREEIESMMNLLKQNNYKDVKARRMIIDDATFDLKAVDL